MPSRTLPYHSLCLSRRLARWEQSRPLLSGCLELAAVLFLAGYLALLAIAQLPVAIQWQRIPSYFASWTAASGWQAGPFLQGLQNTLLLSAEALVLTLLLGYVAALLRLSQISSARLIARLYIQLVRNTPLLVQLYFAYFLLSPLLGLNSFYTALLALSLFEGAYTAEIIRGAIESIAPGQYRAAAALGLSPQQTDLLVVYPQALRSALPVLANQGVSLIKDSALASAIGVFELARSAQNIQEQTFLPFAPWLGVCLIYFVLTFSLSLLIRLWEQRLRRR